MGEAAEVQQNEASTSPLNLPSLGTRQPRSRLSRSRAMTGPSLDAQASPEGLGPVICHRNKESWRLLFRSRLAREGALGI